MSGHSNSSPLPKYLAIWAALLIGTVLTVVAAQIDLGPFNAAVALTIASIKATLVVLFFMHVKGASEKMTGTVILSVLFFLLILLGLSMTDFATRSWS